MSAREFFGHNFQERSDFLAVVNGILSSLREPILMEYDLVCNGKKSDRLIIFHIFPEF